MTSSTHDPFAPARGPEGRAPRETRPPVAARRPAAPSSDAPALLRQVTRQLAGAIARRPAASLASFAAIGAAGVIALNAAAYQAHRHPSPLFAAGGGRAESPRQDGRAEPRREARPESRPEARLDPRPEARAETRSPAPARSAEGAESRAGQPPAQSAAPLPPVRPQGRPQDHARLAEVATGSVAPARPANPEPDAAVAQAQRALARLGHPGLKADGVMGAQTRQAIERFEREHNLKVTGELNPRTLRALQAQARAAGG